MNIFLGIAAAGGMTLALAACSGDDQAGSDAAATQAPQDIAAGEESQPSKAPGLRLYAMDCGRIGMLDLSLFAQSGAYDGQQHEAADMCFLIRHPDGDLLWDAGLPDALNEQEDGMTDGPFKVTVPKTLASQLDAIGVAPDDIDFFSISHSHFDHVGNAGMFTNATFLIDEDEHAWMFRDEARSADTFGLVAPLESAPTRSFDGDHDVFGDGLVRIVASPGHTPGHATLLVNLENEGPVLLSGDLYHLIESREKRLVPVFNTDADQTRASMDRFEALADETGARVIIQHSLEHMDALPMAPDYLD